MATILSRAVNLACSVCQYLPAPLSRVADYVLVPLAEAFCIGTDRDSPLF